MARLIINLQGSLANPNIALDAAQRGDLSSIPPGPTGRIDSRALTDAKSSGVTVTCVTVGHVVGTQDPVDATERDLAAWANFFESRSDSAVLVRSATDVARCQREQKIGVVLGFQNTEMLCGKPSAVERFASTGVRVMQLTYNTANAAGSGCLSREDAGLTDFGRQAVEAMNESGVLVDLSHSSALTLRGSIRVSRKPIAVSHTACRALVDNPRNVHDEDMRLLSDRGGVVGIFAMPFLRSAGQPHLADYLRHIEHAINVVGEDHVAIGTDGTITPVDDVPTYLHYLALANLSRRAVGVSAPGEDDAVALFLPDLCGPSQFLLLADALARRGHAPARIDKLMGLNWMRLLVESWS